MSTWSATLVCTCALLLAHHAFGQLVKFRKCPKPSVQPSFDLTQYLGNWYEVQRYYPIFFEQNLMCSTATYSLNDDGSVKVINRAINRFNKGKTSVEGTATVISNAKLSVSFSAFDRAFGTAPEGNYFVLETDYNNYAVVYSCTELAGLISMEIVWILGRTPTLPESTITSIYSNLEGKQIDTSPLLTLTDIQGNSFVDCSRYYDVSITGIQGK